MTQRLAQLQQARAIKEIRRVQDLAAQIVATGAARDVRARKRETWDRALELEDVDAGWRRAMVEGSPRDPMVRAWAASVLHSVGAVAAAEASLHASEAKRERARRDAEVSTARKRLADRAVKVASRRFEAMLQESRDAELTDQHLVRRMSR